MCRSRGFPLVAVLLSLALTGCGSDKGPKFKEPENGPQLKLGEKPAEGVGRTIPEKSDKK